MSETEAGALAALSRATAAAVAGAAARVVGLTDGRRRLSGLIWSEGRIVTAEECLDGDDGITALLPDGSSVPVELAGRDPSTDVALLRAETGPQPDWPAAEPPAVGALALRGRARRQRPDRRLRHRRRRRPGLDQRRRRPDRCPPPALLPAGADARGRRRDRRRGAASSASPSPIRAGARW